ncbi:MAG TPA: STAS domain-containing protein [Planctomycetota bacterium]|nr:STAS domain-containing protein [Planctomycetota bacterium]
MKVLKENLSGIVVLTLKGEFDSFVTAAFSNEISKVNAEGVHKLVLNMRLVKFVNSTALGAMIKARKQCRAAGGDLVISQPSPAVREAMESLGLDRLFSIHDEDEKALAALEGNGAIDLDGNSDSAVMIHLPDSERPQVARLRRLDTNTIDCKLADGPGKLAAGRDVKLKFRLPLYRKEFFDISARVESVETAGDSALVTLRFTKVSPEDSAAIASFVADMTELRKAARGDKHPAV